MVCAGYETVLNEFSRIVFEFLTLLAPVVRGSRKTEKVYDIFGNIKRTGYYFYLHEKSDIGPEC